MWEILVFVISLLPALGSAIFSMIKPPSWLKEGPFLPHWTKINIIGIIFSSVLAFFSYFFIHVEFIVEFKFLYSLALSLMGYIFVQTVFTDGWQRLADRRILRVAVVSSLLAGSIFLFVFGNSTMWMVYALMFLLATALIFLHSLIGQSDARAIQLIVAATYPALGLERMQWGILLFVPLILIYGVIMAVKNKSFKGFFTKISVPMVPLMLAPFIVVLMLPVF